MALVTRFETPGRLRDLPDSSPFYAAWHSKVDAELSFSVPGPVPGGGFYDASETVVNVAATRALVWMGFPRPLLTTDYPGGRREAFAKGDTRGADIPEGRTTQVEYLEWFTQRDKQGRITKVTFTTETPEYWHALFQAPEGPNRVVELYRQLLGNPGIDVAAITDSSGSYNPLNAWNTTRGIIHYIVETPPNTLHAALSLVSNAVADDILISDNFDNFEDFRLEPTSADPRVRTDIRGLARKGLQVTAAEPIGIYMGGWDDTGWSKPDGSPVGNYWKVIRPSGAAGPPALRLEYEVPASEGFVVSDIRIGGRPIEFGGQLAEHVTVLVNGVAGILA